ncbi:hypothetical protein [Natrarchaeobaculum aegyptiacum]|uniref:hypothetical protein n=1 Tax=Natrarchaeobaculum aegyptiacum TaxID=745377 RepID=UPI00126031F6|nr:hypothetical protein [Natrarchaeobaculum aegyptiacum]
MILEEKLVEDRFLTPWWEADPCPDDCLCHASSQSEISRMVGKTRDNPYFNHAVYVLECRHRPEKSAKLLAINALDVKSVPGWVIGAARSERLLYVGLSKRPVTRIWHHATARGANFTKVFPPVRLLDIDWHPTLADSYREEPKKAQHLRKHLDKAFVSQPG